VSDGVRVRGDTGGTAGCAVDPPLVIGGAGSVSVRDAVGIDEVGASAGGDVGEDLVELGSDVTEGFRLVDAEGKGVACGFLGRYDLRYPTSTILALGARCRSWVTSLESCEGRPAAALSMAERSRVGTQSVSLAAQTMVEAEYRRSLPPTVTVTSVVSSVTASICGGAVPWR